LRRKKSSVRLGTRGQKRIISAMIDWFTSIIPPWFMIGLIAFVAILGSVAYLILLERKIASWVQDRIGPNRTGLGFGIVPFLKDKKMFGLGQPMADGLKFFFKEDYKPKNVDKILFTVAPGIMMLVMIVSAACIPWGGWRLTSRTYHIFAANEKDPVATVLQQVHSDLPGNAEIIPVPGTTKEINFIDPNTAVVTYKYPFQAANLNIGVLFILATLSLAVYGIVVGGWASNNKYSFLGGLRATASMISYEIPLGLSVLCIVAMFGTLDLGRIVAMQDHYWLGFIPAWNIFTQPLAFVLFLICIHAEANRAPFDLAEAEQELVGGYHTEYSSMRFALFFLSEYAGMITTSAVCVALFFGGWHLPYVDMIFPSLSGGGADAKDPSVTYYWLANVIRFGVFFGKTMAIIFVFMWVRWSLPRFRFDQLMMIAWRSLIPVSLALLLMTFVVVYFVADPSAGMVSNRLALWLLVGNIAIVAAAMIVSKIIPAAPETNRRLKVTDSRFINTPHPAAIVN
jgi:NADH-quinone oxidoreductase subunit H